VARIASEQIIDIRLTLRYLGVEVKGPSFLFGDNESVVNIAVAPHSRLAKRHNALSYHKTRWCIAAGFIRFLQVPGKTNPADIVSKHWDMPPVWDSLRPIAFHRYQPRLTTNEEAIPEVSDSDTPDVDAPRQSIIGE
jgi:hypothetical protein